MKSKWTLVAATLGLVFAASAYAVPEGWTDDFAAAQQQAAAEGKDLLLEFTGSDWCPPCKMLKREVFDQEAFRSSAPQDFILVKLDFPNNLPQTEEVVAQNFALQERYGIQGYPTLVLTDAQGTPYAQTGYRPGGAEQYVAHLDELQSRRVARDQAMTAAESAQGLDKARALDEALEAVGSELAAGYYRDVMQQIVALDPDNEAGLKAKYGSALSAALLEGQMQEAYALFEQSEFEDGLAKLDQILDETPLEPMQKQIIIATKGQVYAQMGDLEKAVQTLKASVAVDAESEIAPQIGALIEQLEALPAE